MRLNNALAHERLQRLAALDPLTEVYNRRFGMRRLHAMSPLICACARRDTPGCPHAGH